MQVLPYNMNLKGNGANVVIYTDGAGISTVAPRNTGIINGDSIIGNQLGGTFKLGLLGYYTTPIAFNAAENEVEAALELLPNIGDVTVRITHIVTCYCYDTDYTSVFIGV
jgi:hypothetical protein